MKHSKRARTKHLIAAALRRRGYYISAHSAGPGRATVTLWYQDGKGGQTVKLSPTEVLTSSNTERSWTVERPSISAPFLCFNCDDRGCTLCDDNVRGE